MTADLTPDHNFTTADYKIDYKLKTFKLMKQLAESEVHQNLFRCRIKRIKPILDTFRRRSKHIRKRYKKYSGCWV